ncbi:MAG: type IV pilus biogenesis/stability protein PilW [Gammaproteobacteria bacterium]|nr:type IV pilus biogenesis/stability protein PilW [Gammaproteobacteria bacterium]
MRACSRGPVLALGLGVALLAAGCASTPEPRVGAERQDPAMINAQLGIAYMREGKNELALGKFNKALDADPDLIDAHMGVAVLYERLGQEGKAERHYRRAVELAPKTPKNATARNNFGQFLCARGEVGRALEQFEAAVANPLYERPEIPHTNAGICARRDGKVEQAERHLRAALRANPRFDRALLEMADLSFEQGRHLPARGFFQRYAAVADHTPESLWLGIRIERALGDDDAVASYSLLLKRKFPDAEETRLLHDFDKGHESG